MTTENQPAPSACPLLDAAAGGGASRMAQNAWAVFALAILAGAYIALGGVLAIRCGTGLEWAQWGGMGKFVFAAVFPLGIVLVVICGADLFTGDCMTYSAARYQGRSGMASVLRSWAISWGGNLVGSVFVALLAVPLTRIMFEAVPGGAMPFAESLVKIGNAKTSLDPFTAFWRGVGCNWLVCLAVYCGLAAKDVTGKILALWFPVMAFVAMGFEHCVANMFFIPGALMAGSDSAYQALVAAGKATALTADMAGMLKNLAVVTLGNIAGGAALVSGMYFWVQVKSRK